MLKRLSVIAAVFFLLTALVNSALAGVPYDEKKAIEDALQNYSGYYQSKYNFTGEAINYVTDTGLSNLTDGNGYSYGFLAYGQPHEDQKDGQHRYIGYTFYGENYTNMDFPADKNAGGADFSSQNWIIEPWKDPVVQANNPQLKKFNPDGLSGDGDSKYHTAILAGILAYGGTNANNGYTISETSDPVFWNEIERYVHILSPGTSRAWGIGRMWRYDENGSLWYVTVPIMPGGLLPEPGNLKAVSIDLGVPQGQLAGPGTEYTATVVFENESDQAFPGTPVAVLHGQYQATLYDENGQVFPKKTIGGKEVQIADFDKKGTPGARITFTCKWHPFIQAADGLTGIVNRDEIGKVYQEVTYDDNLVRAEVSVEQVNLAIHEFESGVPDDMANVGEEYIASAIFVNESECTSVTGAPVGAWNNAWPSTLFDSYGNTVDKLTLLPGEEKVLSFRFHGQEGMSTLVVAIDTPPLTNLYEETTEEDNTAVIDVGSADSPVPPVNGELRFQARSKGGYNQYGDYSSAVARPENTAKLLDDVTATLRPDAPTPPKGELVSWSIASASLTYPRQSTDFSMGAPYPPEGNVTTDMNPDGHEATAEFEEDWAMDGVNADRGAPGIYNILEDRIMAAEKKYYTITADYTIDYTYKWQEKKRKSSTGSDGKRHYHTYYVTRYGSGTTSGAAEGYLLVDGVGRALFAQ